MTRVATLPNDTGALRFTLTPAGWGAPGGAGGEPAREVLATAGLEARDARGGEFWPVVQLAALRMPAGALAALRDGLRDLTGGAVPGLAWRGGEEAAVGLQLGVEPGGAVVEVGLDLGRFLTEVAGAPHRPGAELALFRFRAAQAGLVLFGDGLARELDELATA